MKFRFFGPKAQKKFIKKYEILVQMVKQIQDFCIIRNEAKCPL